MAGRKIKRIKFFLDLSNRVPLLFGIIMFWTLRVLYWALSKEVPFSDMAGYNRQGHELATNFGFDGFNWTPFYKSMIVPTLPIMRAVQIMFFGDSMIAWRIFLGTLTFLSLIWLVREVNLLTQKNWLGLGLLFTVAFSKSSIFWSLKIAHEGPAELYIYLCLASAFYAIRKDKYVPFLIQGLIWGIAVFNRPNFAFIIPIFIAQFVLTAFFLTRRNIPRESVDRKSLSQKSHLHRAVMQISLYCIAGLLVYAPWGYRSYHLYGTPFVFSTEGIWGFLWELPLNVKVDDGRVITAAHELEGWIASSGKWKNDYESSEFTNQVAKDWLAQHWREYPALVTSKVWNSIAERVEYLTVVSRTDLFPGLLNALLIDKSVFTILSGLSGLLLLSFYYNGFYLILLLSAIPWLSAAMLVGYSRMLDPMVPIILFGNLGWLDFLFRHSSGKKVFDCLNVFSSKYAARALLFVFCTIIFLIANEWRIYSKLPNSGPVFENSQIIKNPGFETWNDVTVKPEFWNFGGGSPANLSIEKLDVHSGINALKVQSKSGNSSALFQDFDWKGETRQITLHFEAWVKASHVNSVYLNLACGADSWNSVANQTVGQWERLSFSRRISYHAKDLRMHVYIQGDTSVVIDGVTLDAEYDSSGADIRGHN